VYGAIGWRLLELFGTARTAELFGYMVDGMNYTPAAPTFEQMRDGILQSVASTPSAAPGDDCLVWRGFAKYGVGVGASAVVTRRSVTITESFAVPAGCAAP
jgi:extracellular elastinolytic metalloproteinase